MHKGEGDAENMHIRNVLYVKQDYCTQDREYDLVR